MNPPLFGILVQGPLRRDFLTYLDYYKAIGPVVVSHWSTDDRAVLDGVNLDGVTFATSNPMPPSELIARLGGSQIGWRQFTTSLAGIIRVPCRYTIKVRSDEYFSDLTPIMDAVLNNPLKLVTTNVFFRKDKCYKFHPSDHLLAGPTDLMTKMFVQAKRWCETRVKSLFGVAYPVPEQMLAMGYLVGKGVQPNPQLSIEQMKEHVQVVRLSQLGDFIWRANSVKLMGRAEDLELWSKIGAPTNARFECIQSMDDL